MSTSRKAARGTATDPGSTPGVSTTEVRLDGYTIAWLAWLAAFVVIEGKALLNRRPDDTLSEHVWKWFATADMSRPVTGWVRFRRFVLLAFLAWLVAHFLTGGLF